MRPRLYLYHTRILFLLLTIWEVSDPRTICEMLLYGMELFRLVVILARLGEFISRVHTGVQLGHKFDKLKST